jgi:hypothetical protein
MRHSLSHLCLTLTVLAGPAYAAPGQPVPVEVWTGAADDGLTQHLCDALETTFSTQVDFSPVHALGASRLIVLIPKAVEWAKIGDRTHISYSVIFKTGKDRVLANGKGSCWEDDLSVCAGQVVRDARATIPAWQIH